MAFTALTPQFTQQTNLGGFPAASFAPTLYGQAIDRLGMPSAANPAAQLLAMNMQQNQLLLDMMQMLMMLMAPGTQSSSGGGLSALSGSSGDGSVSSIAPVGSTQTTGDAAAGGPKVQKFIDAALSKQGTRYVFGAQGPDTFDCSGLVAWALKQAGSSVGRMTAEGYRQHYQNAQVSKDQLKPGDLVFFSDTGHAPASHIEIYIGGGETMGAHSESMPNGKARLNTKRLIMAARPPELQG
jgi:cell wall-associated NlpC family hydrolase